MGIPDHDPSLHVSVEPTCVLPDVRDIRGAILLTGGVGSTALTGADSDPDPDPVPDPVPNPNPDPNPDPSPDVNPGTTTIVLIVPTL